MRRLTTSLILALNITTLLAQNDVDVMRYSRGGTGGSSRFLSMGGAFGAVGADPGCAGTNPGGLAVYRKGELSFSGGLKLTNNSGSIHGIKTRVPDGAFVFNNFGLVVAWDSERDVESRHVLAFNNVQLANYVGSTRMSGYTNSSSIARDMLTLANESRGVDDMNNSYERMGFETFVLDTMNGKFISMLDTRRTVQQTRDLVTSGRMNELNFSYAYSYKDKYYVGGTFGIPRIEYSSSTMHTESDDKDSMRIVFTSPNSYTHTYSGGLPEINDYYAVRGGFNSLTWEEYFRTTGSGFNLKLGGVARVSEQLRLGFYYHTPTIFRLTDVYVNTMFSSWDQAPAKQDKDQYPSEEGFFEYRAVTPSKFGLNAAFLFGKKGVLGVDYEVMNYARAQLRSSNLSDFANANSTIQRKYSYGHNLRIGGEVNISPFMVRAGYNMQGSPFGHVLIGDFVRHTFSIGLGLRTGKSLYFDAAWLQSVSSENYYPFVTLHTRARINFSSSLLSLTAGIKF
jgi:hypothetical protein